MNKQKNMQKSRYQKVLVVCPGNAMTAGPEALHQLVERMNALGQAAAMVYHPFHQTFTTPLAYQKYKVPVEQYEDRSGNLILFPEIFTQLALKPRQAQAAIWWMSVNNFTGVRYQNPLRDKLRFLKNKIKGRIPWRGIDALRGLSHFAQSHYATLFLQNHGVDALPLSDPIPFYTEAAYLEALPERLATAQRTNRIFYNPHKGAAVTAQLRAAFPSWDFMPLSGYDRQQLAEHFLSGKLYIDFGHHPGKDRLPREAALHGCCVITGRYGSTANGVDVPIDPRYKLDPRSPDFLADFEREVQRIFRQTGECQNDLVAYRRTIANEPANFDAQITTAFLS
ncbi:hypothetical protein [Rhodoferax sp. WC2427]|uniref:hypothetical protein n=1 Tax=Rhodoferax sp. WC2427 TaxID=3234144 RepID=UPI003467E2CE